MNKKIVKLILIMINSALLSGAGYVGDLPNLSDKFKPISPANDGNSAINMPENKNLKQNVLPLKPNDIPSIYSGSIIKRTTYSPYLKDLEDIIPILEKLNGSVKKRNSIQHFNAISANLDFQVAYLSRKYYKKPESSYESFVKLKSLNKQSQAISKRWIEQNKNLRFVSNYERNKSYEYRSTSEQLINLGYKINEILIFIKENTEGAL